MIGRFLQVPSWIPYSHGLPRFPWSRSASDLSTTQLEQGALSRTVMAFERTPSEESIQVYLR